MCGAPTKILFTFPPPRYGVISHAHAALSCASLGRTASFSCELAFAWEEHLAALRAAKRAPVPAADNRQRYGLILQPRREHVDGQREEHSADEHELLTSEHMHMHMLLLIVRRAAVLGVAVLGGGAVLGVAALVGLWRELRTIRCVLGKVNHSLVCCAAREVGGGSPCGSHGAWRPDGGGRGVPELPWVARVRCASFGDVRRHRLQC